MRGLKTYWKAYGGWDEIALSPYFNFSWFFALFLHPLWTTGDGPLPTEPSWVSVAFSVLPSVIGFSLGSIAILISVSSGKMLEDLQHGGDDSLLMKIAAAFFHFLLLQVLCLLTGLAIKAHPMGAISYFGCFLLIYAISSGIATASILISVARLRNWVLEAED